MGPSIASGSQTWSGNWALLPTAPQKTRKAIAAIVAVVELGDQLERLADVERPGADPDEHDPEGEADVADAVDDERLLGGEGGRALRVPEPDQEVRAQAHQLPGGEDGQPAVAQDEQEHAEHEEVQVGEEAPAARVVGHVAHRVEVDEHADRRHDDEEAGRQLVDVEAHLHLEGAGRDPGPERDPRPVLAEAAAERLVDDHHRDRPGGHDQEERDQEGEAPDPPPEERREDEAGERQDEQQRHEVDHAARRRSARPRRRRARGRRSGSGVRTRGSLGLLAGYWRMASYSSTSGVRRLR